MSNSLALAAVMLVGIIAYAVFAGADFGGGVWDIFATGPRRNQQRRAIAAAIGPVWEANHVWLIFVVVLLFTAFPRGYAALSVALFVPFHWVLLGIIARGVAFVFRSYGRPSHSAASAFSWGTLFGAASVITPMLLGMSLGALSTGSIRVHHDEITLTGEVAPWLTPLSWAMGAFALTLCAYLAAVYLANETSAQLREDFRRRALLSGTLVVALSGMLFPLLHHEAPFLWHGLLQPRAAPVLIIGGVAALVSGAALWRRRYRLARVATVAHVVCLLLGWGLAHYPYLIYPDVTLNQVASDATLRFVLGSLPLGLGLLLPSLWFLFRIF